MKVKVSSKVPENYNGHPLYTMENCTSCKACQRACKQEAIIIDVDAKSDGRKMLRSYILDFGKCNYCGECAKKCPNDTIIMVEDFGKMEEIVGSEVYDISKFIELKKELRLRDYKVSHFENPDNCIGCQLCVLTCPVSAISVVRNEKEVTININPDLCGGCGECIRNCPALALGFTDYRGWD